MGNELESEFMEYFVKIDDRIREKKERPFTQIELRNYIIDNKVRLTGIDFQEDITYLFASVKRKNSLLSPSSHDDGNGYGWGV